MHLITKGEEEVINNQARLCMSTSAVGVGWSANFKMYRPSRGGTLRELTRQMTNHVMNGREILGEEEVNAPSMGKKSRLISRTDTFGLINVCWLEPLILPTCRDSPYM